MFNPYQAWLDMSQNQPPTYYQLLGIAPTETNPRVIEEAALGLTSRIRIHQMGPYSAECVQLLNEIAQAETTLLHPVRRKAYNALLRLGATAERNSPQTSALKIPARERRLAIPGPCIAPETLPFANLFESGPIIEVRSLARCIPNRNNNRRRSWPDPLVLVYLGFLLLSGVLGYWWGK
jgi:hypothetical protein